MEKNISFLQKIKCFFERPLDAATVIPDCDFPRKPIQSKCIPLFQYI